MISKVDNVSVVNTYSTADISSQQSTPQNTTETVTVSKPTQQNQNIPNISLKTVSSDLSALFKTVDNSGKEISIGEQAIEKVIETANKKLVGPNIELSFSVHKETNRVSIKVTDQTTGDVIREIPPEKILDMIADMCNLAGKFVDVKR